MKSYKNTAFFLGQKFGSVLYKAITPRNIKSRAINEDYMKENTVFIDYRYVVFNIIEVDRENATITVNITDEGHHSIDTFTLYDMDGWTYFEYGHPTPEKIYLDDFQKVE